MGKPEPARLNLTVQTLGPEPPAVRDRIADRGRVPTGRTNSPPKTHRRDALEESISPRFEAGSALIAGQAEERPATTEMLVEQIRSLNEQGRVLASKSRALASRRLQLAMQTGGLLIQLKGRLPHGDWEAYVEEVCGIKPRTARDAMTLAENRQLAMELLASNRRLAADLTVKSVLKEIAKAKKNSADRPDTPAESGPNDLDRLVPAGQVEENPDSAAAEPAALGHESIAEFTPGPELDGVGTPEVGEGPASRSAPGQETGPASPTSVGGEGGGTSEADRADAKAKIINKVAEVAGQVIGASPPESRASPKVTVESMIDPVAQLRNPLREPLIQLRTAYRLSESAPWKFRNLWAGSRALREQVARLLTAEHFSKVSDCEKCLGAGFIGTNKPCTTCAGVGLAIAPDFEPPIEAVPFDDGGNE